jgi:hypothetical protein
VSILVAVGVAAAIFFSGGTSLGLSSVGLALVAGAGAAALQEELYLHLQVLS